MLILPGPSWPDLLEVMSAGKKELVGVSWDDDTPTTKLSATGTTEEKRVAVGMPVNVVNNEFGGISTYKPQIVIKSRQAPSVASVEHPKDMQVPSLEERERAYQERRNQIFNNSNSSNNNNKSKNPS